MKYIMFKCSLGRTSAMFIPIVFPTLLDHSDVAVNVRNCLPVQSSGEWEIHSAGEVDAAYSVWGHSESLGVRCDPADGNRIMMSDHGGLFE